MEGVASQLIVQVFVLGVMIYALLLVIGAPFGGPKLANRYAKWVVELPFRLVSRLLFGKKKKRKKRQR